MKNVSWKSKIINSIICGHPYVYESWEEFSISDFLWYIPHLCIYHVVLDIFTHIYITSKSYFLGIYTIHVIMSFFWQAWTAAGHVCQDEEEHS